MQQPLEPNPKFEVRWVIYSHVVAVLFCLTFSLADRGLFLGPKNSQFVEDCFQFLLAPALLAWLVCPGVFTLAWWQGLVPKQSAILGFTAEILLSIMQVYALLPAVM